MEEIPEAWREASRKLWESAPPMGEEQRRGLTRIAIRFARRRRLEALRAESHPELGGATPG